MATASYSKTAQGNGYLFHVTPAPKVNGGCAGLFFIILISGFGSMLLSGVLTGLLAVVSPSLAMMSPFLIIVAFIAIAVWLFKKWDMRKKNHRHPSAFFVAPDVVKVEGQQINRADIHRLIIRNAYEKVDRIQLTGQTVPTGVAMGHDLRNALEQISYGLNVETGGRAIQLAGGMDDVTVNGLFTDVRNILGFS